MAEPDSNYVGDSGWDFPCDKCGACCRVIDCVFLTKENKCSIYGNRPFICDTKKMFDKIYSESMSKEEYFKKSEEACNKLKELHND